MKCTERRVFLLLFFSGSCKNCSKESLNINTKKDEVHREKSGSVGRCMQQLWAILDPAHREMSIIGFGKFIHLKDIHVLVGENICGKIPSWEFSQGPQGNVCHRIWKIIHLTIILPQVPKCQKLDFHAVLYNMHFNHCVFFGSLD